MNPVVRLGGVPVGPGYPPLLLPEIGTYFDRDVEQARQTIRRVKEAGAQVIKGEVFHTPDIVLDDGFVYRYATHRGERAERYRTIIERKVLPFATWQELYGFCHEVGLPFVVSAYDLETVDFLVEIGAAGIKLASNNLVHVPLLRHAAKSGLPLLLDTGKANLEEVARAVAIVREAGGAG